MKRFCSTFFVNGNLFSSEKKVSNLADLLKEYLNNNTLKNIAVAVNDELVERSSWKYRKLKMNDRIEIVKPFNGG